MTRPRKAKPAPPTRETPILEAIRGALGRETDLVLWRNNVGGWKDPAGRVIRYGLCEGSADLVGVLRVPGWIAECPNRDHVGIFFALEVKRPGHRTGKRRAELQRLFLQLVRRMGGFAAQVESVGEARSALARAREGGSE